MRLEAKQVFYGMIGIMLLSFGGIIAAFYWGNQQLEAKASVISNLQTDNDIAQEKLIALDGAKQSTELKEETEKLLSTLLPDKKEQEKLVADVIYTAVAEAGIPVEKLGALNFAGSNEASDLSGTEQSTDVAGVYTYPFTMSVQEISYDTLLVLLEELENNGRLVQIENLQITPDKLVPGQISSINLSLKAFLKP
jgi:Tfp pilus assembly protein PilO